MHIIIWKGFYVQIWNDFLYIFGRAFLYIFGRAFMYIHVFGRAFFGVRELFSAVHTFYSGKKIIIIINSQFIQCSRT